LLAGAARDRGGLGPRRRRNGCGAGANRPTVTPDQQAIVDTIAKPDAAQATRYAGAPTDAIGSQVTLPLGDDQSITLVKTGSVLQQDGSVVWHGEVPETGERAMLMLWSNALLTGYFVINGGHQWKDFHGRKLRRWRQRLRGNGSPAAAGRLPGPGGRRDGAPTASLPPAAAKERQALRPAPAEPSVVPFAAPSDRLSRRKISRSM